MHNMEEINIKGIIRVPFSEDYIQEFKDKTFELNFKDTEEKEPNGIDSPGIYCWGFFDKNNQKKFIPYYVGESTDSIRKRITQHIEVITTYHGSTNYRRLKESYFYDEKFGFRHDPDFPLYINKPKSLKIAGKFLSDEDWRKNDEKGFNEKIFYWSKMDFNTKKSIHRKVNHNIIEQTKQQKNDVLFQGIVKGRFGFFYWPINADNSITKKKWDEINELDLKKRDFLEIFESLVKFSLKTKTGSNSISLELMRERIKFYFGENTKFKCVPNDNTKEYFRNQNEIASDVIDYKIF